MVIRSRLLTAPPHDVTAKRPGNCCSCNCSENGINSSRYLTKSTTAASSCFFLESMHPIVLKRYTGAHRGNVCSGNNCLINNCKKQSAQQCRGNGWAIFTFKSLYLHNLFPHLLKTSLTPWQCWNTCLSCLD